MYCTLWEFQEFPDFWLIVSDFWHCQYNCCLWKNFICKHKQGCIPVGRILPTAIAVSPAMHTPCHACPLPCMPPWHAHPPATHAPLPCTSPCHACPHHTCPLPCISPAMYSPCHACPPAMHAPLPCMPPHHACSLPCMPPTMHVPCHTCPPATHTPCHACLPMDRILDTHLWKHYLRCRQ